MLLLLLLPKELSNLKEPDLSFTPFYTLLQHSMPINNTYLFIYQYFKFTLLQGLNQKKPSN